MSGLLRLPDRIHRELIAAAKASPDEEVCGLLAGTGDRADQRLPVENRLHRFDAFDMAAEGLIDAMRRIREEGWTLLAIYHSHPGTPPWPSETDLARNQYPEALHLIIGREEGDWRIRAFRLEEGVEEVELEVAPDSARN